MHLNKTIFPGLASKSVLHRSDPIKNEDKGVFYIVHNSVKTSVHVEINEVCSTLCRVATV